MSDSPEAIRADIDRTRAELGQNVDALADKVTPSKIVGRQTDKMKGALGSVRDRIMGAADDAGSTLSYAGSTAAGSVTDATGRVTDAAGRAVHKAQGNPLAVGLIAFGAGLLAASLIPASSKEKDVAATVKEKAQPLVDGATDVAKEIGEHLKEPAQDAAAALKDSASEAVETVKSEATDAAGTVKDQAQQARENVSGS
jgi:gas vesicle protein